MALKLKRSSRYIKKFLENLAQTGNVTISARAAGVSRAGVYKLRDEDDEFAKDWADAVEQAVDVAVDEVRRRAIEGKSDTLLMFYVKAHRPEYATERREHSAPGGGPIKEHITVEFVGADE